MKNLKMSTIKEKIQELELSRWRLEDRMDLMEENRMSNSKEYQELDEKQKCIEHDIYLIIDTIGENEFIKTSIPTLCFN